jgi:hypothetical protein
MSQMLRFILLIALIAAVSVGVYYWFEGRQTGVEKSVDDATDELQRRLNDGRRPAPERPT